MPAGPPALLLLLAAGRALEARAAAASPRAASCPRYLAVRGRCAPAPGQSAAARHVPPRCSSSLLVPCPRRAAAAPRRPPARTERPRSGPPAPPGSPAGRGGVWRSQPGLAPGLAGAAGALPGAAGWPPWRPPGEVRAGPGRREAGRAGPRSRSSPGRGTVRSRCLGRALTWASPDGEVKPLRMQAPGVRHKVVTMAAGRRCVLPQIPRVGCTHGV